MKVIYSYSSYGGMKMPDGWWLRMAELSVQSMKNCGYTVELYTDAECAPIFTDNQKFMPTFNQVHIVDFMQFPHDAAYWNFGKLLVYSLQREPFLHVDFDTYFKPTFKIPEDADIVTEMQREYTMQQGFRDAAIFECNKIPAKLICSGLLGGSAFAAFADLFDHANYYCKRAPRGPITFDYLVGVEEFNISQIADFRNLRVKELPKDFLHFQGANKRDRYDRIVADLYERTFNMKLHR